MEMQAITAPLLPYARDFKSMFAKDNFDILLEYYHQNYIIELLPDSKPRSTKVYLLSSIEQKKLNTFLEENLCTGWIYLSKLPIVALVFFIKKKNSSLQLVQDYWALNSMIMKNKYSLLLISKLILQLYKAKYFTKLDICWSFNNVHIKSRDKQKTIFYTNYGLFEPLVIFIGITNSPAIFQMMINNIFRDLITKEIVVAYLDNILIFMLAYSCEDLELNQGSCSERTQQSFSLDFPRYLYKYQIVCVPIFYNHMSLIQNYILHNPSYAIYIFPTLYSWMFPIKLMNTQEIVFFLGVIS